MIGVNLTGFFFGCKRAAQQFLTQDPVQHVRGRIINISSQHGMVPARRGGMGDSATPR